VFERPLGFVEISFDSDGVNHGGRVDLTQSIEFQLQTKLTPEELLKRIKVAWTVLRCRHILLSARIVDRQRASVERWFVIDIANNRDTVLEEAEPSVTSLLDHDPIDIYEFHYHALNTARMVDPEKTLSKLIILPLQNIASDNYHLRLVIVVAHVIADGVSLASWIKDLMDLINMSEDNLNGLFEQSLQHEVVEASLPPAQEDLYPPIAGSRAQQLWFWAIIRILRHIRKPLPDGLPNPLRRRNKRHAQLAPQFSKALDYSPANLPPNNSGFCKPVLSLAASKRLTRLCQQAGTTIGAGIFALVGVAMMDMEERLRPGVPLEKRRPFITSFPINPRPLLKYEGSYDSCMVAFCGGIVFPFLPASLNFDGRFRLLTKVADRQMRVIQKRRKSSLGWHESNVIRMLATSYITNLEEAEDKSLRPYRRGFNPQGSCTATTPFPAATCGVSSLGSIKWSTPPNSNDIARDKNDLFVELKNFTGGTRAREGGFMCTSASNEQGVIAYMISYDSSAIDDSLVEEWKTRIETILEPETEPKL
jgi:hypothetical protein